MRNQLSVVILRVVEFVAILTVLLVSTKLCYNAGLHRGIDVASRNLTQQYVKEKEVLTSNHIKEVVELKQGFNNELEAAKEIKRLGAVHLSRGGFPDRERSHMQVFTITAYSPYDNQSGIECDGNPNDTATDTKPKPGTFAVDPKVIPYGSAIVVIYDDGTIELGKAEDCGGWVKGKHIDVFRYTYAEAKKFGVKKATVMWYKEEKLNGK